MFLKNPLLNPEAIKSIPPTEERLSSKPLSFIMHFVKKMRAPFFTILCLYSLGTLFEAFEPVFFGYIINGLIEYTQNNHSLWESVGIFIIGYIICVQVLSRVCWQLGHRVETLALPACAMFIRQYLGNYLNKHSYTYFLNDYAGRLASKVIETPSHAIRIIEIFMGSLLFAVIMAIFSIGLFMTIDTSLTLIMIAYIAVNTVLIYKHIPLIYKCSGITAQSQNKMRGLFTDIVSNSLLIKIFNRHNHERKQFSGLLADTATKTQAEDYQVLLLWRYQHITNALLHISVLTVLALGFQKGQLTIKDVSTVLPLTVALSSEVWGVLKACLNLFSQLATIEESLKTILKPHTGVNKENAKPLQIQKAALSIKNLNFSYSANQPIFKDFSLEIPKGQKIGLIGPSGAGKSTLAQLLLRLYDINDGEILIDNQNIQNTLQESLREHISFLPQANDLMHRTIRENIAYAKPDATDEEIIKAAKKAYAHDFIMAFPEGYSTFVGERGVKLSGGQKQRIAIARAFLKDAPFLILDEATSALDSTSEQYIQKSLKGLMKNKTVIVIAHRLSTIAHLDRIIVLDGGKIVEDGTHTELFAQKGAYHKLWQMQSKKLA